MPDVDPIAAYGSILPFLWFLFHIVFRYLVWDSRADLFVGFVDVVHNLHDGITGTSVLQILAGRAETPSPHETAVVIEVSCNIAPRGIIFLEREDEADERGHVYSILLLYF